MKKNKKVKISLLVSPFFLLLSVFSFTSCQNSDWWNATSSLTNDDIGTTREVNIDNITYQVRLIGIDQDTYVNNLTAHTTWEFINVLDDSCEFARSMWDDSISSRFDESVFNVMLNWDLYKKFPEGLKNVIKYASKKNLHYYNFDPDDMHWYTEATYYYTWIFPLSMSEMSEDSTYINEGETYAYYKTNHSLIKTKINSSTPVYYWTRSPDPSDDAIDNKAYYISSEGEVVSKEVENEFYYSLAFCI